MKRAIFFYIILVILLSGCKKVENDFGISTFHPSFLWSKADTIYTQKTLILDFSEDAIAVASYADLEITDIDGNVFASNKAQILINGNITNGKYKIDAGQGVNPQQLSLKIRFLPASNEGKQFGLVRISNHNLDRVDNISIKGVPDTDIFKWEIVFEKNMNPLKKSILFVLISVLALLFIWFFMLKRFFHPVFPKFKKQVKIGITGVRTVVFTGCREVVFSEKEIRQNLFGRIFKGKIQFVLSPEFTHRIIFKPYKKNARAIDKKGVYRFSNNPIPRNGLTQITNTATKTIITLN